MRQSIKKVFSRSASSRNKKSQYVESIASTSTTATASEAGVVPRLQLLEGQHGLYQLNTSLRNEAPTTAETYDVDVVAIHGLNGDLRRTWTHENGVFWLESLLPQTLPGARVFTYGYPAKLFQNPSISEIRHYAIQLLSALVGERENDEKQRPIIFICHSLGGIVFKQAMISAFEEDDRFGQVWLNSKGVILIGTPHRGSSAASLGKILGDIANTAMMFTGSTLARGGTKTSLLKQLSEDSATLKHITQSFRPRAKALLISTFYETEITPPTGRVIVTEDSAVLNMPHEQATPLNADHRMLARFSGPDDKNYIEVSRALRRMAKDILAEKARAPSSLHSGHSFDDAEKLCVSLLNTTDVGAYEARLDRHVEGTLNWILESPQFMAWLSTEEAKVIWVTGYAGCGKTIMASYITEHLKRTLNPASRTLVCRFFCDGKLETQRDASAILRSIIYQIVVHRRRLLRVVKKACDFQGVQLFSRFEALWDLFMDITDNGQAGTVKIVIDALNECDEATQRRVIVKILGTVDDERSNSVKFFITGQPNMPAVQLVQANSSHIRLRLEDKPEQIVEDVKLVVRKKLDQLIHADPNMRAYLENMLIEKAETTFLWVALVLSVLEDPNLRLSTENIEAIAQQLRPGLANTYEHLLSRIPTGHRHSAGSILRFIASSERPLNLDEIDILLGVQRRHSASGSSGIDVKPSALGALVRISDSKAYLVHQTLADYLTDLGADTANPLSADFGVDVKQSRIMLIMYCMDYLKEVETAKSTSSASISFSSEEISPASATSPHQFPTNQAEADGLTFDLENLFIFKDESAIEGETFEALSAKYRLYDYAATQWADQFARYNSDISTDVHKTAIDLCSEPDGTPAWFRYFWARRGVEEACPSIVDELFIAAFFGHTATLDIIFESPDAYIIPQTSYGIAIYCAARNGHAATLEKLLQHTAIRASACTLNRQPAISAAAHYGHLESVKTLLADDRFDPNTQNGSGRTPLAVAAGNGHADVVKFLLARSDVEVDVPDPAGSTAFHCSITSDSEKTISLFLRSDRVNHGHVDKRGRNVLSWAAELGLVRPVKLLVKSQLVDIAAQDSRGRTALMYAAYNGHLDIVRSIVRSKNGNLLERDNDGRNAISWAASQANSQVLHYLVNHAPTGADIEDNDGWTPLAWAMDAPGYPDNVSILIQSGQIDINRIDRTNGRTTLSWAAAYGYVEITRLLSSVEDVDLESRDFSGRTPLSYAAGQGTARVVELLIETRRVDINSRDDSGRTPLSWAAGEGHVEIMKLLMAQDRIDVECRDKQGRTALDFAKVHGQEMAYLEAR